MDSPPRQLCLRLHSRFPAAHWNAYGDSDPYILDIQASVSFFGTHFLPIEERIVPDTTHCAFDHIGRVTEVWNQATGG